MFLLQLPYCFASLSTSEVVAVLAKIFFQLRGTTGNDFSSAQRGNMDSAEQRMIFQGTEVDSILVRSLNRHCWPLGPEALAVIPPESTLASAG